MLTAADAVGLPPRRALHTMQVMPAVADRPSKHVRTFDLTVSTDREDYEDLIAGESEYGVVRVLGQTDFPMGGTGAIMRVVDFSAAPKKPEFSYDAPIC